MKALKVRSAVEKYWFLLTVAVGYSLRWTPNYGVRDGVSGWKVAIGLLVTQSHYQFFFVPLYWAPIISAIVYTCIKAKVKIVLALLCFVISFGLFNLTLEVASIRTAPGLVVIITGCSIAVITDFASISKAVFQKNRPWKS